MDAKSVCFCVRKFERNDCMVVGIPHYSVSYTYSFFIYYLKKNKLDNYIPYFISSEGTEAFYNANYNLAIKKLSEAIRLYNDQWPHLNDIFYIGLSNWKLGKRDVAVK